MKLIKMLTAQHSTEDYVLLNSLCQAPEVI